MTDLFVKFKTIFDDKAESISPLQEMWHFKMELLKVEKKRVFFAYSRSASRVAYVVFAVAFAIPTTSTFRSERKLCIRYHCSVRFELSPFYGI